MLQAMRNGMDSWFTRLLISALFLFALGGLVLSDAGGFFRGGVSKGAVAEIGSQELSFLEFDRAYRTALSRLEIPELTTLPQYREILARDTLKTEIRKRVLGFTAHDNGLVISDEIAAKRLREYLKPLTDQGMLDSSALQYVLEQRRMSENMLVNTIKSEFAIQLMMTALTAPVYAPWQLVSDIEQYNNESRSANYIKFKYRDFPLKDPNDTVLEDYYTAQTDMWMTPEYREVSLLSLTPELVVEKILGKGAVTDEDLQAAYQERLAEFSTADKRFVSQASFTTEEDAKAMMAFLNKNPSLSLEQSMEKNKNINGFFLAAEEYTKETILPQELTDPVFDFAKDKGLVGPVKSPLGWHLASVEKTVRGTVKTLDEVKTTLRNDIVLEKSADPLFELVNELEDMFAGGDSVKEAADFLKLPITTIGPIDAAGNDVNGKAIALDAASRTGLNYAFTLREDDILNAEMKELESGSFIAFSADNIVLPKKIPFAKVKADVLAVWKKKEQNKQIQGRVRDIISAVRTGKSDLKDHVLGKNAKISYMPLQKRHDKFDGANKDALPDNFLNAIFDLSKEKDISSIPADDGVVVFQLKEIKLGKTPKQATDDPKNNDPKKAAAAEMTQLSLDRELREDIIEQFLRSRIDKYGVKINEYSFSKQYGADAAKEEQQ